MKKLFLALILSLALGLCGPAQAANYYFDLASGNDTTGDGTYRTNDPAVIVSSGSADSYMLYYQGVIEHDSSSECRSGKCLKLPQTVSTNSLIYKVGAVKIPSTASDLTLKAYIKKDASFNGIVDFIVIRDGEWLSTTRKTPTESYVQESVVVSTADLVANEYLDLYVRVIDGSAGSLYVDDFSAEQ